jgi:hypothetical protein
MFGLLLACVATEDTADSAVDSADTGVRDVVDVFADELVSFEPGDGAGFGQDQLPDIVLGSPEGKGEGGGSLHVVSLGNQGVIVLAFTDLGLVDGEGVDLLVFENAFAAWPETAVVAASEDGETWSEWPCDVETNVGCAGVAAVLANSDNGIDPTDPVAAGGDAFDLADIGLQRARFVRIRDSGENPYEGTAGGFDLDALAVVNGVEL